MEFRHFLAEETTSTLARLLGQRSEQSAHELDAFKKAFANALSGLESALAADVLSQQKAEISALADLVSDAAAEQERASAEQLRAEARAERDELQSQIESLTAMVDTARERAAGALADLMLTQTARDEALADLRLTQTALDEALDNLALTQSARDEALADLALTQSARDEAHAETQAAEAACREQFAARELSERELRQLRDALQQARGEATQLTLRMETAAAEQAPLRLALREAQNRLESAEARRQASDALGRRADARREAAEALRDELEQQLAANASRIEALEAQLETSTQTPGAAGDPSPALYSLKFDRLIPIYQELESSTSVATVLTALARGLGHQFQRVALFNVGGSALQGAYQVGFDIEKDIAKIVIPLSLDSIATRAVTSGTIETVARADSLGGSQLPFGGATGWSMALPLAVKGHTVAILYADEGDQPTADASIRASKITFADLLRRHATAVLAKLTIDLKELSELSDYATLLLDEVEYIYGSDVSAGKQNLQLVEQLTENLRCARETFVRRLSSTAVGESGLGIFEERMNTLIDVRGATPFGRHLSIAAAAVAPVDPSQSEAAAQAS
jgi:chemotaxis protein histidine kinase CheA